MLRESLHLLCFSHSLLFLIQPIVVSYLSEKFSFRSDDEEFYDADEELIDLDTVQEEGGSPSGAVSSQVAVSFEEVSSLIYVVCSWKEIYL